MNNQTQWLFEVPFSPQLNLEKTSVRKTPTAAESNAEWETTVPCEMVKYRKRPGKTKDGLIYTNAEGTDFRDILLYDFDIDAYDLKPGHKSALDILVKFMADNFEERQDSGKKWTISLDGYTSRTGASEHNKSLSQCRVYAVRDYLSAHFTDYGRDLFPHVHFANLQGHGFDETTVQGEDPLGRSVRIAVHRPEVKPPDRVLPTQRSTKFRIRSHGTISGGPSKDFLLFPALQDKMLKLLERLKYLKLLKHLKMLTADVAIFELHDLENRRFAFFLYVGGGLQVPVPIIPLPAISASTAGKFLNFETTVPLRLENFAGLAQFTQPPSVGSLNLGSALLTFKSKSFGLYTFQARTKPSPLEIDTGPTYGVTIFSSTHGQLIPIEIGNLQTMNFRLRQTRATPNQQSKLNRRRTISSPSVRPVRRTRTASRPYSTAEIR